MADVRFISSSIVQAEDHRASGKRIELTPWDLRLLAIGHIQKGLLFPKPKPYLQEKETENTLIHHLKTSLSRTLDYFPLLAGRLETAEHEDDAISLFVDCNNAGALFIHAAADGVTISDIIKPVCVPPIIHSFFPLNGLNNYKGITNPLLGIQITDLADGIFVGCTINHAVADGTSFWHFFNSWSEISKGSIHLSKPPVFQCRLPDGTDLPIRIPQSCLEQINEDFILPPLRERVFHFTKENIAKLKAKANAEIGTNNISSLQALMSHIWRSVIRNKILDPNEETNFRIVVGARRRLQELSENYFGNAMLGRIVKMKAKELLEQGIGNVAWQMNSVIAKVTEETFKKFLQSWPASPKLVTMSNMTSNTLVISSSPRFNMYGNDFGWGKPIAVRSGSANKFDGKITLFCGAKEGSIDIEACLSPEILEAMANDQEFIDIVTV
ncbi:uncharacterized acetyltransferase At3g50280-like [Durio zibethinus]|uniref:Uncharacterized acetyltransferase At3g50280-like n=1 Tax=Durio zibethinus TaxID=66656 RepID=A0A6P5YJ33_DURZI|nr:uncharacterized acetyltransferase At3g50280-like [Durio zibethinus]XP_022740498.1 uncharacterized acetyltransferase At3g50280-like [Durio zibethinus]